MTDQPGLFALDASATPLAVLTPAQALRSRQAARIAAGLHPLALDGTTLRLHADAARPDGPRCGTCVHRKLLRGRAKPYPKCMYGYTETPILPGRQRPGGPKLTIAMPRVTRGAATDVLAAWPACTDWTAPTTEVTP